MNPVALIETAKALVVERPSDAVISRINAWVANERLDLPLNHHEFSAWTYAIAGNDRTAFYDAMIKHQERMTDQLHMGCAFHWVEQSLTPAVDMFERCLLMTAYLHFTEQPVVFLDNDAFPNADMSTVFDQIQDIGLTARDTPGLMPVNEGVIFAKPTEAACKFFLSYLGTYERLRDTMAYDDWRWFGGQLALNAVAETVTGSTVRYLPCITYNFSPDEALPRSELDKKVILHLKGNRKVLFDQVVAYQESRL